MPLKSPAVGSRFLKVMYLTYEPRFDWQILTYRRLACEDVALGRSIDGNSPNRFSAKKIGN